MITVFIYGNSNNKHCLLRKVSMSSSVKGINKGKIDLEWFKAIAKDIEPNMTSVWIQK